MIKQLDDLSFFLCHKHNTILVDAWILQYMEEILEKLKTSDPFATAQWAHEIMSLEEQWS